MAKHTQTIRQQLAEELFLTTSWGWHWNVCGIFLRKQWTTKNYFHKKVLSEILDGVLYVALLSLLLKTCSKQTIYKHGKDNTIFHSTLGFLLLTPDAVVHRYFSLLISVNEVLSHDSLCSLMTGIFINLHLYAPYKEVLVNFTIYCNAVLKTMDMVKVIHQPTFNCSKSTIGTLKQEWKVYKIDTRTTPLTSRWCCHW